MDPAQTALFLVIIALTILLIVLGTQVFFVLRELRQTIVKTNKVLDEAGQITESVSAPLSSISALAMGLKTGASLAGIFKKDSKRRKHNE
ncbi:MAG: hypothetical protein HYU48_01600 [Candidatus Levybacteria bacterium]|nr:hypothetical protein [Candidatus Levybacteria bacterium]